MMFNPLPPSTGTFGTTLSTIVASISTAFTSLRPPSNCALGTILVLTFHFLLTIGISSFNVFLAVGVISNNCLNMIFAFNVLRLAHRSYDSPFSPFFLPSGSNPSGGIFGPSQSPITLSLESGDANPSHFAGTSSA